MQIPQCSIAALAHALCPDLIRAHHADLRDVVAPDCQLKCRRPWRMHALPCDELRRAHQFQDEFTTCGKSTQLPEPPSERGFAILDVLRFSL